MKSLQNDGQEQRSKPANSFYLELFNKLDRLGKLMLIVCPYSPIHEAESKSLAKLADEKANQASPGGYGLKLEERFETIRKLFMHLSYGTAFHDPKTVRDRQMLAALKVWIQGSGSFTAGCDPVEAIKGKINVWLPTLYSGADSRLQPDEVADLEWVKTEIARSFEGVENRWRKEGTKRYRDWFEEEIAGHASVLLNAYRQHEPQIKTLQARIGTKRFGYPRDPDANLMMRILEILEDAGWAREEGMLKVKEFLASPVLRQIPIVRIGSALWAGLAHNVARGGWTKKGKYPSAYDVQFISAYLPYCDAMFTDNACAEVLKVKPASQFVPENAKVYSMKTKDGFLKFLDSIESTASPGHRAKVCEVYGDGWIAPSTEILAS